MQIGVEVKQENTMKQFNILFAIIMLAFTVVLPATVQAMEPVADGAAQLAGFGKILVDKRVDHLRAYLESHNSPIADQAHVFVREADRHNLDWKLVAAIAGAESTFGKHIPPGSYNGWGWGIPTGAQSGLGFKNWEQGIMTVSEGLAKNYYGRGAKTIYDVGWIYAANGNSWGNSVSFFMKAIEQFTPVGPEYLEVSI
jgi:hypothetical protein